VSILNEKVATASADTPSSEAEDSVMAPVVDMKEVSDIFEAAPAPVDDPASVSDSKFPVQGGRVRGGRPGFNFRVQRGGFPPGPRGNTGAKSNRRVLFKKQEQPRDDDGDGSDDDDL